MTIIIHQHTTCALTRTEESFARKAAGLFGVFHEPAGDALPADRPHDEQFGDVRFESAKAVSQDVIAPLDSIHNLFEKSFRAGFRPALDNL